MFHLKKIFIFLYILCAINFFEFQAIRGSAIKYFQFGYLLLGIIFSLPYAFPKFNKGFILPIQLICFSIIFSIFVSLFTWGQNILDSLGGTILVLVWLFFFYLKHVSYPIKKVENLLLWYGLFYIILYFFQFIFSDKNYFIDLESVDHSRGITRIVFPGQGVFYATIFIAINRLTTQNKWKLLWIALSILGIIITIMQVTRQYIFVTLLIYMIHFIKKKSMIFKISMLVSILSILTFASQLDYPIIQGIKNTQEQTVEDGTDYVRIKAAIFFINDFSHSYINQIFGNGEPYGDTSPYNRYVSYYVVNYGYWLSDVGLIAVYAMFGIVAVIGYILIWVKSFTISVPEDFFYLKYYLWYLLLTSLTSATSYLSSNLIATVLIIYIYQIIYEKKFVRKVYYSHLHKFPSNSVN